MPNTTHPLDIEIDDMHETLSIAVRVVSRDGEIDADERMLLDRIARHPRNVGGYRFREVAADRFKRNGFTRLTREAFQDAGYGLTDLDRERVERSGKIVPFRTRQEAG